MGSTGNKCLWNQTLWMLWFRTFYIKCDTEELGRIIDWKKVGIVLSLDMCVQTYVCVLGRVHMCLEVRDQSEVFFLRHSRPYFVFHQTWSELIQQDWPISKLQGTASICSQSTTAASSCAFSGIESYVLLLPNSNVLNFFVVKMKPANTETFQHVTTLKMATKDDFYWIIIDFGECNWTCNWLWSFWRIFCNDPTIYINKCWPGHPSESFQHFNVSLPSGY